MQHDLTLDRCKDCCGCIIFDKSGNTSTNRAETFCFTLWKEIFSVSRALPLSFELIDALSLIHASTSSGVSSSDGNRTFIISFAIFFQDIESANLRNFIWGFAHFFFNQHQQIEGKALQTSVAQQQKRATRLHSFRVWYHSMICNLGESKGFNCDWLGVNKQYLATKSFIRETRLSVSTRSDP